MTNKSLCYPIDFGKGPKMSMPYFPKGNVECIVSAGWMAGGIGVNRWHLSHFLTISIASNWSVGQ